MTIKPIEERFWDKVSPEPNTGCWLWTASLRNGYGQLFLKRNGRKTMQYAHIFSYKLYRGLIPRGLQLDHLCRNPMCVSPYHLQPVTCLENIRRGIGPMLARERFASRLQCIHGHNLRLNRMRVTVSARYPQGLGKCRACRREQQRNRRRELSHLRTIQS
jgi:hypothetical protein